MRKFSALILSWDVSAQTNRIVKTPDFIYAELFTNVQMEKTFPDGKTFVDCVPKKNPGNILAAYQRTTPGFTLRAFVDSSFIVPVNPVSAYASDTSKSVKVHKGIMAFTAKKAGQSDRR
jgi:alpha,alpha-trehalase